MAFQTLISEMAADSGRIPIQKNQNKEVEKQYEKVHEIGITGTFADPHGFNAYRLRKERA